MDNSDHFLSDPQLLSAVQRLRRLDNVTNGYYLAFVWLYLLAVIGGAMVLCQWALAHGVSWPLVAPGVAIAVVLVGAGQHQLAGAGHEATHHILFKNKWLNELAADWLCMFPLYSTTFHFRLHHLAHHQFVNDPQKDPDFAQLEASGHRFDFPLAPQAFLWQLLTSMNPFRLVAYIKERAKINAVGQANSPYRMLPSSRAWWGPVLSIAYLVVLGAAIACVTRMKSPVPLAVSPLLIWMVAVAVIRYAPRDWQLQTQLRPVVPLRILAAERATFLALQFTAIAWLARCTGIRFAVYYLLLWVLPIFTSFAFFMILRQVIQHGNCDRGRLTNTKVFFVGPALRFAVFPFGMDLHLPHHMFATVPHFRLRELHALLSQYPRYATNAMVVEGYFTRQHAQQKTPCAIESVGPHYARAGQAVYVDATVVEQDSGGDAGV